MVQSSDQANLSTSKTPSARALIALKSEILKDWEAAARAKISTAAHLERPLLIDTLPTFLDNLAEALAEEHPRRIATEATNISEEHGGERARLSRYGPDQLIVEYQLLRDVISDKLEAATPLTPMDRRTIQLSIDQSVCEAMTAFFLVHSSIREQFVASLTHDLRNPLGVAKMSAELLLLALSDDGKERIGEDMKSLAQRIINSTKRADRMIQDLLDTTVIHMGEKIPLKIAECEMLAIVKEVIADVRRDEVGRIQVQGSPCWGYWDADAIRRAIENLITNALKYGGAGTPVTIRITSEGGRLMLSVHNHGESIPLHEQEMLFQAFRRAQAAKHGGKKGWGIGLALVRGVAEGHGGSIALDSLPERGTTFIIDIPVDARPYAR